MHDLIIRGGKLVNTEGIQELDVAIEAGKIVRVAASINEAASEEIFATGLHLFPALIDVHVHFNEPGRSHWEGIKTGSSALAAGGGTLFVDMPLNAHPPLLRANDFHAKKAAAEASSVTDFAFWGGLTPDNLEHLPELAELGVVGFKAFMSNSGIPEFKAVDDYTLYEGMRTAVKVGLPVAVHAESDVLTTAFSNKARAAGQTGIRDYLDSRPIFSEVEAISRALVLAQETGCDLHIVHVSSVSGLARISEAKQRGIRVTAETCPHYLHFTDEALERLGAVAKCAPPLRSEAERQKLWQALLRGEVDIIASDHSPSSPDLKEGSDFFAIWGGIAGLQSSLNVLLSHAEKMALPLAAIAAMTSSKPASRFGFKTKGRLEPGYDADLCLVNLNDAFKLESKDLFYKHQLSPYCGESFKARVVRTVLRGKTIFVDGQIVADASGQFLQPTKNANRLSSAEIF